MTTSQGESLAIEEFVVACQTDEGCKLAGLMPNCDRFCAGYVKQTNQEAGAIIIRCAADALLYGHEGAED